MTPSTPNQFARKINNWIAPVFMLLTVLATILSLAGYLGKFHEHLELAADGKLQYLLVGLCPFIYFTLTRRKIWWIVSLFCVLINLAEILPWYIPQGRDTTPNSGQLVRLFLFNVLYTNNRYDDAIALVRKEKPDLAVFLEVISPWSEKLEALRDILPYRVSAEKFEIRIYSSVPLENPQTKLYGEFYGKKRGYVVSNLKIKGKEVTLIATHACPQRVFGTEGFKWRNKHLEEGIGDYVGKIKKPRVVIGDLNVSMWSQYYRTMMQRSGLRNARLGFGVIPSLTVVKPWLVIPVDHCLVSPDIKVVNMRRGPDIGSDHFPVITDIVIPVS